MKKALIFIVLLGFTFTLSAQTKHKEVGLRTTSLFDFNFLFKKEMKKDRWFRARAGILNLRVDKNEYQSETDSLSTERKNGNIFFGATIGFEKRKFINEQFAFIVGPETGMDFRYNSSDGGHFRDFGLSPKVGMVLGFMYEINKRFNIGIEFAPAIRFDYSKRFIDNDFDNPSIVNYYSTLDANFNNLAVTAVYRFKGRKGK